MGIMDDINAQSEADRIKFEREQAKRVEEAKNLNKEMGDHNVPESKRPV